MAELPFPSRRRNNYAGSGRRIYANSYDYQTENQAQEWESARAGQSRGEAGMGSGFQGEDQMRRLWNGNRRVGVQNPHEGPPSVGIEIRKESGKHANGKGPVVASYGLQDQDEDIKSAATLLLARAGSVLFTDLCESCSALLHHRLTSLASGECLSALLKDPCTNVASELPASSDRSSSGSDGSSAREGVLLLPHSHNSLSADTSLSENGVDPHDSEEKGVIESPCANSVVENFNSEGVIMTEDDAQAQASRRGPYIERRMGSVAASSNDNATHLIIKSALHTIRNAPAYRTRSLSRQAGLLKTPDENLESGYDNRENARILKVGRKKDFCLLEQVNGRTINVLEGLELHTNVLDRAEQKELIDFVYELQELGRNHKLRKRTYSEPRKWMRGKGRVTIQFGCCYNYATDKDGNPPGIIRVEEVDEIPPKLRMVIKRLVQWHVLPSNCIPDSCIVNIYDIGDCIPPHIDHHDFVRPFCTLSLLSECDIIFGTNLKIAGPGEFKGSISVPLPTGSVLILNGNGADVVKHAVPAVPSQRISITFRKMDPAKVPYTFRPDVELLATQSLMNGSHSTNQCQELPAALPNSADGAHLKSRTPELSQFSLDSDFPALGKPVYDGRLRNLRS